MVRIDYQDALDNDGFTPEPATIQVAVTIAGDEVSVDFTGTDAQRRGSINSVLSHYALGNRVCLPLCAWARYPGE